MPRKRRAEEVVREFWDGLAEEAAKDGWLVGRRMDPGFSRGFVLQKDQTTIDFKVRISQAKSGFWGLPFDEAQSIIAGKMEHNLLLTGASSGYFLSAGRLPALLATFSRSEAQGSYKINEGRLRREKRFVSARGAWQLLRPPSAAT